MSDLKLFTADFRGSPIHTLTVGGRPAWIAREVGAILGYANEGKRFVTKITGDWCDDLVANVDYAILVGEELAAIKAQVGGVIAGQTVGLVVLFESGLHMALVKTHMPIGRALRRFLVSEVLPQIVRTGAYAPTADVPVVQAPPIDVVAAREYRLAAKLDLDDRKFRSRVLNESANVLFAGDRLDGDLWAACVIGAAEIALGQPLPMLYSAATRGWLPPDAVAMRLRIPVNDVLAIASVLAITTDRALSIPVPTHGPSGWTVSFRFSPMAVAQIDAWLDEQLDQRAA